MTLAILVPLFNFLVLYVTWLTTINNYYVCVMDVYITNVVVFFFPFPFSSDLALRNCYLTVDLTVKVGDYGIGPHRYKVSRYSPMPHDHLYIHNFQM